MVYEPEQFGSARVVVLSPGGPQGPDDGWLELGDSFECVSVHSPYEAAAEILCGGVVGLVVDLTLMVQGHGDLLDIARQADVRAFGVGEIPAGLSSGDLSGIYLVDRAGLPAELRRAVAARPFAADAPSSDGDELLMEPLPNDGSTRAYEDSEPEPPPRRSIEVPGQPVKAAEWADHPLLEAARRFLGPKGIQVAGSVVPALQGDRPDRSLRPEHPPTISRPTGSTLWTTAPLSEEEIDRIVNISADGSSLGVQTDQFPRRTPPANGPSGRLDPLDDELLT